MKTAMKKHDCDNRFQYTLFGYSLEKHHKTRNLKEVSLLKLYKTVHRKNSGADSTSFQRKMFRNSYKTYSAVMLNRCSKREQNYLKSRPRASKILMKTFFLAKM